MDSEKVVSDINIGLLTIVSFPGDFPSQEYTIGFPPEIFADWSTEALLGKNRPK